MRVEDKMPSLPISLWKVGGKTQEIKSKERGEGKGSEGKGRGKREERRKEGREKIKHSISNFFKQCVYAC